MKLPLVVAWLVAGAALHVVSAADRVPIEDFARAPALARLQLSPDGKSVAYLREFRGRTHLCVLELGKEKVARFQIGSARAFGTVVPKEVRSFGWISNRRLVLTTTVWDSIYGMAAVNSDGSDWVGLTGNERDPTGRFATLAIEVIHEFNDDDGSLLVLDRRDTLGKTLVFPEILRVDTATGLSHVVQKNPGRVVSWLVDHAGTVRLGMVAEESGGSHAIYREKEDDAWHTLPLPSRGHEKLRPLGFDRTADRFFVTGLNEQDRWAIFPYDLQTGARGEALVSDPEYDTAPGGFVPSIDGVPLARPVFSRARDALIGIWYLTDAPRVRWFDPEFVRFQAAVDKALPNTLNVLAGQSADDQQLLVFAFSDRDPGAYYLFDRQKHSFSRIGARMPWIKPAQMSPMFAVKYTARDGTPIHGYLTVPRGHQPKSLPLVVLPHGGPWVRDVWGFDPLAQMIASRGYAVLQMNYRGSPGYGSAFSLLGKKQVGLAIQDDIEDATRWAISSAVADPERVAIVGGSFGGYAALFALGKSPELYRCGISIAGVSDWLAIFRRSESDQRYLLARRIWRDRIGDLRDDEEFLKSISPVNFANAITAPLLIIQGKEDRTVPPRQATEMIAALEKAGHRPESDFISGEDHRFTNEKGRIEMFTRVAAFLEKHLGPGVPLPVDQPPHG